MKGIPAKISRGLPVGARLVVADNTGAREVEIISVIGYKGRRRRYARAGLGDMLNVAVKRGKYELKKKSLHAVVVRQKKEFRRPDGLRVAFEDNAAVIATREGDAKGTEIKGPIAKEVAERWPRVGAIASMIV